MRFPKKTLAKVERCIYCGSREGVLGEEHIVPFGLSGPWVLERASCTRCAGITSGFERTVLKASLMVARATMGLQTRRPRQRPTQFVCSITKSGKREEIDVPVSDLTGTAIMLVLAPPAYLDGRPYVRGRVGGMRYGCAHQDQADSLPKVETSSRSDSS